MRYTDRKLLRFHKPRGMSYSHFRCLIKQRVNFANRCPHGYDVSDTTHQCQKCGPVESY